MTMTSDNARPALLPTHNDIVALPDAVLVERAKAGDPAAFELIMRRYNQRLYRLTRGILRSGTEAEDVLQETYLRVYEKLADFIGPDGFASWIGKIAINEALGRLRKRGRVILMDDYVASGDGGRGNSNGGSSRNRGIDEIGTQMPDPERLAASSELRHMLEHAIDALPDDFRAVFILRAVEGMNVVETADFLSIRPETVKTRFHRARQLLQKDLGAKFETLMPSAFAFGGLHCDRITSAVMAQLAPAFATTQPK